MTGGGSEGETRERFEALLEEVPPRDRASLLDVLGRTGARPSYQSLDASSLFGPMGAGAGLGSDCEPEVAVLVRKGPHPPLHVSRDQRRRLGLGDPDDSANAPTTSRRSHVYRFVARGLGTEAAFLSGRELAIRSEYPTEVLERLDDGVVSRFVGLGNPFQFGLPRPGQVVVDLGCGAGFDVAVASSAVGASGRVLGVDWEPEMVRVAQSLVGGGSTGVMVSQGSVTALPVRTGCVDVAVANGLLVLFRPKTAVLAEMFRILRPGGRLLLAELAYGDDRPVLDHDDLDRWNCCRYRIPMVGVWRSILERMGFVDVRVGPARNPFQPTVEHGNAWSYTFEARRP